MSQFVPQIYLVTVVLALKQVKFAVFSSRVGANMQSLYSSVFSAEMGAALCCCGPTKVHDEPSTSVIRPQGADHSPIGSVLVFVNPNSGAGKGVKTFHSKVADKLQKNNIHYELVITTGPNHARQMVSTRDDIAKFNGIIILSGDGLVFEVLNGLCERKDAGKVVPRLPIAVVPSGSGNGLLSSLFASKGWSLKNPEFTNHAIVVATGPRPEAQPMNLIHIQTEKENISAFLSVGWGLMADIDIESEKYRKTLGSNRFTVSALVRCMKLRTYRGRLSYKPFVPSITQSAPFEVYRTENTDMITLGEDASCSYELAPSTRPKDVFWSSRQAISVPELEKDTPDDWIVIDDEFIGVYAVTLSHISADGHFMPGARIDDDRIYLTYILRKDVTSKMQLVKLLLALEKGEHIKLPYFHKVDVSAFRLEPHDEGSLLVVDGEVVDATHLQATVTNLKTAVFT